ncbi:MAG TPA: D-alanyl-D-alanine carboxypeptidase, partial [Pyrinomonadaceae bacterium]|nr:D-alanyl-D-alanine carboxypeptidase [Pyrinomonadaceae bacterium]
MNRNLSRQSMLVRAISVALFVLISLIVAQSFITDAKDPKSKTVVNEKAGEKTASSPADLAKQIDTIIDQSEFAYARWGVYVISLTDGAIVYQRDGDRLFTPASNMKIYTTGVALDLLGADYRWRTSVYANAGPDASGTIHGDLVLYGRGAPDLVSTSKDLNKPSLSNLVEQLYQKGVRRVDGNVIGDASYFRGDPLGDGWQWTDLQWYFGAEASALSINGNEVDVNVVPSGNSAQPAEVRVSNAQANVAIQNRMGIS